MGQITMRILGSLSKFSAAHPWSHNDAYMQWVLWQARKVRRTGGAHALDVGCGTGNLLRKLAKHMDQVTGVEPDAETAARARTHLAGVRNAAVLEQPFEALAGDAGRYDLVTFVAVLHHLPLDRTLETARSLVRPGGRLIIVGLAQETSADLLWSLASMLLNPVVGFISHPRRSEATPEHMTAPTAEPMQTFEEIVAAAQLALPGVRLRRSLFWRYRAVWTAPASDDYHPETAVR